jgi:hypothetical protein
LDHYINSTEILSQDNQNRIWILKTRRVNRDRGTELAHPAVEAIQLIWDWAQNRSRCSQQVNKFEATPRPGNYFINRGREGYLFLDAHVTLPSLSLRVF